MTGPPKTQETGPAWQSGNRPSDNNTNLAQSTGSRPQEWHADLGLVDDDQTPDLRPEGWTREIP